MEQIKFFFFFFTSSQDHFCFLMNFTTFLSFNSLPGFEGLISDDFYDWIQVLLWAGKVGGIGKYMFQGSNLGSYRIYSWVDQKKFA